ncbi:MAG: TonB-dependent receptor [Gammaproteobacteria bacterium]|nr:TonB-dependent receptor [Gammaproteobacteria bacterium]
MGFANQKLIPRLMLTCLALVAASPTQPALAQEDEELVIEEIITIGSRSQRPRSAVTSTAPVDVFSEEDFNRIGNAADITDNLRALTPSYNATTASGDQDTFVRPVSMRGLAPDQTLVMINGKRRHRAALVAEFTPGAGKGAHGPNIGMIPSIAIKNVEILRDGAAAQYGADAIAGVINFQMKDASKGGALRVQYGEFYQDEQSYKVEGNIGLPLGDNGFINASVEYSDNDALSRGHQRPNAQTLIDNGVPVGADTPFDDAPFAQTWGRPQTENILLFVNSGIAVNDNAELYLHGNYAETDGRYRFFFRNPEFPLGCSLSTSTTPCIVEPHSHLRPLREAGLRGLPAGFTPFFDGDHTDFSVVGGIRGDVNGLFYDVSVGYGEDELDFLLNNTISRDPMLAANADGSPGQRDFDVGAWTQEEINVNADLSKQLTDRLHFALGAEWREETFIITPGEPASYSGAGASGFKGFVPADSGSFSRENHAIYGELEFEVTDRMLTQYAVRYEDFSDFGSTVNGKLAARYDLFDSLALRGAISTGFHAPTPGQSNVRKVTTTFDANLNVSVEEGTLPPDHPLVLSAGGAPLKEEQSVNLSLGFAADLTDLLGGANTTLTVDLYRIKIDDRIYKTSGAFPAPHPDSITTDCNDIRALCTNISFFTNALDMESEGVDVVLTSALDWSDAISTDLSFAFSYNEIDITGQSEINGQKPVSASDVEDIENSYPNERFVVSAFTTFADKVDLMIRANYYGSHYDQRGTIDGPSPSAKLGSEVFVDLELGYNFNDNLRFLVGASNVFDAFVDKIRPADTCGSQGLTCANRWSQGMPYARRAAANYEGGSWYVRAGYNW